jgi:hypothetical protein
MESHRRNFLLATVLAGAGTAVAVSAGLPVGTAAAKPPKDEPRGYRVSEHILKYYKTNEI